MSGQKITFVIGASDVEMSAIADIAREGGHQVIQALDSTGRPVRGETAYEGTVPHGTLWESDHVVLVECQVALPPSWVWRVDHHRPGDVGYGMPPERYMEASSIGQVLNLLGIEPTQRHRLIAAGDHCPGHAYRGACPGVDPEELLAFRAEEKAAFQRKPLEVVLAEIRETANALNRCPMVEIGGWGFRDVRGLDLAQLPEASAYVGAPVLYRLVEEGRPTKVGVLNGSPDNIKAFMQEAEKQFGLQKIYGDPARGYAGGYEPRTLW